MYHKLSEYESEFGKENFPDSLNDDRKSKTLSADTEIFRKQIIKNLDYRKQLKALRESKYLTPIEKEESWVILHEINTKSADPKLVDVLDADGAKKSALVIIPTKDKSQPFKYYSDDMTKTADKQTPNKGYTYTYDFEKGLRRLGGTREIKQFVERLYKSNGHQRGGVLEQLVDDIYNDALNQMKGGNKANARIKHWANGVESFKRTLPLSHVEYQELMRLHNAMIRQEGILSDAQQARYEELRRRPSMLVNVERNEGI